GGGSGGSRARDHGRGAAAQGARGGRRQERERLGGGMSAPRKFLLVGLTGGIGTGKSTVSTLLRQLGCEIIDADVLAREVVGPGRPARATIAAEFGPDVVTADGMLDRKRLGAIVFANPERRRRLEAITHPAIRERFQARLTELAEKGFVGIVIYDAPVILEAG